MIRKWLFIVIINLMLLSSCNIDSKEPLDLIIPTPEEGKSSVAGQIANKSGESLANTTVRLAEVYRDDLDTQKGAFLLDTAFSPGAITNEQGVFIIASLPSGEYVLVVGDVESNNYVIISDDSGEAQTWNLPQNESLNLGKIIVDFDFGNN